MSAIGRPRRGPRLDPPSSGQGRPDLGIVAFPIAIVAVLLGLILLQAVRIV